MVLIDAAARSHVGRLRRNNEDNFYFHGETMELADMDGGAARALRSAAPFQVYAVCDGMGGEAAGEQASTAAVKMLLEIEALRSGEPERLAQGIRRINEAVCRLRDTEDRQRVGSTLAMAVISDDSIRFAHLGDSRVYRYRQDNLTQITIDHTEAQRRVRLGMASNLEDARKNGGNALTQHLGVSPEELTIVPDVSEPFPLTPDDYWIICSDGLTDPLPDDAIAALCASGGDAAELCDRLVKAALDAGGWDNVTVIALHALPEDHEGGEYREDRPLWDVPVEPTVDLRLPPEAPQAVKNPPGWRKRLRSLWAVLIAALGMCVALTAAIWIGQSKPDGGVVPLATVTPEIAYAAVWTEPPTPTPTAALAYITAAPELTAAPSRVPTMAPKQTPPILPGVVITPDVGDETARSAEGLTPAPGPSVMETAWPLVWLPPTPVPSVIDTTQPTVEATSGPGPSMIEAAQPTVGLTPMPLPSKTSRKPCRASSKIYKKIINRNEWFLELQ
ncbi:MAG: SpoIIE family protein phosphatase [Oscillospiraceae bacterium]|jgi:protein phosphatase|nr:SpoIIE family protein phosphatase [Oscillospiraceae bacterium]